MMNLPDILSHAYLVSGGSGESRSAYGSRMAAAYLCEGQKAPCGTCRHCRKIAARAHPDVVFVSPAQGKRDITVDQIRTLRADAYIRPNEGKRKVYIIDPADKLNPSAQNALLKVLEEGPDYAAFLLLTGEPGQLLDTVRSRCEMITLPPEQEDLDPELLQKAEQLARLLLTGDELSVAEGMARLEQEKPKAEQLFQLLSLTAQWVGENLNHDPRRAVKLLNILKEYFGNSTYNPNPGHTLGWLAAELFR